jgi:hypothetical protein
MTINVETEQKTFCAGSYLTVEVGTTGPQGGDGGCGGRTYLRLFDDGGTTNFTSTEDGIEMVLQGDSELTNLIAALRFAANSLESPESVLSREDRDRDVSFGSRDVD